MLADRVKETSTTTGTGALTLGGAAAGFRTFAAGVGNGNKCHYVIENATVPGEWEIGIGTATATPDQLSRDTVLSSSNGGSLVNFSAGTKSVFVSAVANNFEADLTDALGSVSGSVTLKVNHYQTITATIGGATTFSFDGWPSAGTPKRSVILTNGGSASVTWPTITWVDGSAPTLQTTGVDRVDIWRTGGVVYGKLVKQTASSGGVTATVTLADNVTVGDFVAALNSGSVERVKQEIGPGYAGSPTIFDPDNTAYISAAYDSAAGKIVIAYTDGGNSNFGTAIVGTVSGTTISFGTAVVFESASTAYTSAAYDSAAGKIVIAYSDGGNSSFGTAIVGTVSGTTISFGTAVVFESASTAHISAAYDSAAGKIVIAYRDVGNSNFGTAIVGTVSGATISFGTAVVFESASTTYNSAAYDSAAGKIVIAYSDVGNSESVTAIVGTVSGATISFGTASTFGSIRNASVSIIYNSLAGSFVILYQDQGGGPPYEGTAVVFATSQISTNSSDVIGVAAETKSSGQTCAIIPMGAVDTTPTGLSVGQDYYITSAGVRTTTAGANVYVGRAVASNQLLLRGIAKR